MFGLLKTFYIKPHERAFLFERSHFQGILGPGLHRRMGWHWNIQRFDLNDPSPQIENLGFLLQSDRPTLEKSLIIVETAFNEVALVQIGRHWQVITANQQVVFWRGLDPITVHHFNFEVSLEIPAEFVSPLQRLSKIAGVQFVQIPEGRIGLLYEWGNFVRPLLPGNYGFWSIPNGAMIRTYDHTQPDPQFPDPDTLLQAHLDFLRDYCTVAELGAQQVAIARHHRKVIAILPPCSRKIFWREVSVEIIDINHGSKLSPALSKELVSGLRDVLDLILPHVHMIEVPAQHLGLLYLESAFHSTLEPGWHLWWKFGQSLKAEVIDLRLQTLEVAGQEILSKDKVPLRLNLTAGYRITDPLRAKSELVDIPGFLYKELQFALRGAVGTKTLDELLDDKGAIDQSVADYILQKIPNYGIEVESVGVKDIILPGEIKTILSQVVEAEKAAQANVIRRREETAATRSMLNTARVMENNPTALRLKELEILERIADKIERINVNGSLDNLLTEVIHLSQAPAEP
ncbi:slipin family protein [Spirulina sp. CCNP1310]|nr:slipin family protein [Spirulina sp. CCNP1310]MEA5419909.1 slipin family protein [Spirulina sp. CCNP1310]